MPTSINGIDLQLLKSLAEQNELTDILDETASIGLDIIANDEVSQIIESCANDEEKLNALIDYDI